LIAPETRATLLDMKNTLVLVSGLAVLALGSRTAFAGGSEGSIGVGAEYQLAGLGGVSANYDMGQFHLGGFMSFDDDGGTDDTDVALGGRFYFHLHSTAMSDFGIGGSFGVGFIGDGNPNTENATVIYIEPGLQVRAFVASNVALSFTAGLTLATGDADGIAITGQPTGVAGVHYYFF
jgi:hypothetical protein